MKNPVYIEAFSAIVPNGLMSVQGTTPWQEGQCGPSDVRRDQVLDKPYPPFGKLMLSDRLAFSAASLILSNYPLDDKETTALCCSVPYGSFSTDMRYMESVQAGFPSPAIFSATLPSSAVTDIAIYFGLKGENRIIANASASGYTAFEQAMMLLECNKASSVLVLSVNALEQIDADLPLVPTNKDTENRAFGFLLSLNPQTTGLGLRIETSWCAENKEMPTPLGELYFYELIKLCAAKQSGVINVVAEDCSGRITIVKDSK